MEYLNKFHQIGAKTHTTDSNRLHKKKRDLERLIRFKQEKELKVDTGMVEVL